MRGLRELELHLDHTDMGTPELKLLGKSFSSTLKRLCLDLRSCQNLKQDCRLKLNSCINNTQNQLFRVETPELGSEDNRHILQFYDRHSPFCVFAKASKTGGMFAMPETSVRQ